MYYNWVACVTFLQGIGEKKDDWGGGQFPYQTQEITNNASNRGAMLAVP